MQSMRLAATVEGDALMSAGVTLLDVPADCGGAATLGRTHDAASPTAESVSVLLAVGRPGQAEVVRHVEPSGTQRPPQK